MEKTHSFQEDIAECKRARDSENSDKEKIQRRINFLKSLVRLESYLKEIPEEQYPKESQDVIEILRSLGYEEEIMASDQLVERIGSLKSELSKIKSVIDQIEANAKKVIESSCD